MPTGPAQGPGQPTARHGFVVVAYGQSPTLDACLRSLRAQTVPGQVVIATSTPSEHIDAIAARWNVPVAVNPVRHNIGTDWNFAMDQAAWPCVTLAHQDDVYAPDFAARSLAALDRQPDAGLVFTSHGEIDDEDAPRHRMVWRVKMLLEALFAGRAERVEGLRRRLLLSFGDPIGCSAVTFNRAVLGSFRFDVSLEMCLDWDAWWRLHLAGVPFAHVPERLVLRRYNQMSETWSGLRDGRRRREDALLFSRIWPTPLSTLWAALYRAGYQ